MATPRKFVQPNSFLAELAFRIFAEAMIAWEHDKAPKLDDIEAIVESTCEKWFADLPTRAEFHQVEVAPNSDREPEKGS